MEDRTLLAPANLRGVDVLLNPSASHFAFGKQTIRRRLVLEGSRAFGVSYLYANLLGNEAGRAVYDGGGMIATAGNLLTDLSARETVSGLSADLFVGWIQNCVSEARASHELNPVNRVEDKVLLVNLVGHAQPIEIGFEVGDHDRV